MITKKIRILFPPTKTDMPIVSILAKDYDVVVNILRASIKEGKHGRMIFDISGESENVEKAMDFMRESDIEVHEYKESVIRYEDKCVDCGACVGVCPSKALTMGEPDYQLKFNYEKCVLCGLCIKACPVRAITFFDDDL